MLSEIRTVAKVVGVLKGSQVSVQCVGAATFYITVNGKNHFIQVEELVYVPCLKTHLLSVGLFREKRFTNTFGDDADCTEEEVVSNVDKTSRQGIMK